MPKITIRENDVSTASAIDINSNVVYVPGYAITGPVNTPILCETLEDFQQIFGTKPYRFKDYQEFPAGFTANAKVNGAYALKNEYEKSYIYAADLLKSGLPVVFERVMHADNISIFTAKFELPFKSTSGDESTTKFVIKAKNPGTYGTQINVAITEDEGSTPLTYTLNTTINAINGIPKFVEDKDVKISFDATSEYYFEKIKSDLVEFELTSNIGTNAEIPNTFALHNPTSSYLKVDTSLYDETGMSVVKDEFTVDKMYKILEGYSTSTTTIESVFDKLTDRGEYQIKFITSGSYPTFEYNSQAICNKMLDVAGTRGDAIALLDHTNNINRVLTGTNSVLETVKAFTKVDTSGETPEDARKYGAMFTPWATYRSQTMLDEYILPGSFAYLNSLAVSVRTNANWYAVAGVTRGFVPNLLQLSQNVTGAIASAMQSDTAISINPITNIKPYGYCIWGNRTLHDNKTGLVASSFLNIRMLSNDVKKVVYQTAKRMTFELNDNILWLNFKAAIEPTLDQMVSGNGLSGYKIIRKATTKKATIEAIIRLYAIEAVENWDITIELADAYVSVQ